MIYSDMPHFNGELIRWLIAYFLTGGNKKTETVYEKLINFAKISPTEFRDIVNEMIINGYIIKDTKPVYALKQKCKNILEITNYRHLYSLTQEGKRRLCLGWEFATSAVPKELYNEALEYISLTNASITPPFI